MLRSRFSGLILKSLEDLEKRESHPEKVKEQKEEFLRKLREKEAIVAETKKAEELKKQVVIKKQREIQRKAARLALEKMEADTIVEDHVRDMTELYKLGVFLYPNTYLQKQFGLYLKEDWR